MDEQGILNEVLDGLNLSGVSVRVFTLVAHEKALRARLQKDIDCGLREADVLERSVKRLAKYERMSTEKIDVSEQTAKEAAKQIAEKLLG